ncbi:MAG: ChbG/HpnK family deacetylase [Rickettsiales bacterium]|jgi:predicted glycoside hydrolase/deacetylase ChbG (UPF0249 family)|nr:ChbG/HpnK family deacetylase [Rickettsiales bacterium]
MRNEILVNADDLGARRETNDAIFRAAMHGGLSSASVMANMDFAEEAIAEATRLPELALGVHLNLTDGRPLSNGARLLTGKDGAFNRGFLSLWLLSLCKRRALCEQAEREFRAQIEFMESHGVRVSHIDSHRHIHHIPALFATVEKLALSYKIPRVRVVNESLGHTLAATGNFLSCLRRGGLAKWAALGLCNLISGAKSRTYFYSILHTMRIWGRNARIIRVPRGFAAVEVNLHPSTDGADRLRELGSAMQKNWKNRVSFERPRN